MWLENESPELDLKQDVDAIQHESIVMAYLNFLFSWQVIFRLSDEMLDLEFCYLSSVHVFFL